MARPSPVKGPFPDGDSRNITLTKSDNPNEPPRTGPREPRNRKEGAPRTVMGDLAETEMKDESEERDRTRK